MPGNSILSRTPGNTYKIYCMGDSLTDNYSLNVPMDLMWPGFLESLLQAQGCLCEVINCGVNGDRTSASTGHPGMTSRMGQMSQYGSPYIGIIFGGVNDYIDSIATTTSRDNIKSMVNTLVSLGCIRNIVVGAPSLNFGGGYAAPAAKDTFSPDVEYTNWSDLRVKQAAAAAAADTPAVFFNMRTYEKNLVINATSVRGVVYTQGDHLWHFADGNIHRNAAGEAIFADGILTAFDAAWITAMKVPQV